MDKNWLSIKIPLSVGIWLALISAIYLQIAPSFATIYGTDMYEEQLPRIQHQIVFTKKHCSSNYV